MKPDFDIQYIIERTGSKFGAEVATMAVRRLVENGFLEQYIDEDGDFRFALTEKGTAVAKELDENPAFIVWFEEKAKDDENENYEKD